MSYRVRIDEKVSVEDLKSFFNISDELVIVHHMVNDNPHFHLYIRSENWKSPQAMRYAIRTKFKNLNKTDYSIKTCDESRKDEYIQYLFNRKHGNVPTLMYTTMDTTSHQQRALEVYNDFMEKYKSVDEITTYDICKMLAEWIRTNGSVTKLEMVNQCIEIHNKYGKSYCVFSLERVLTTAMGLTDQYRSHVINSVMDKVFPQNVNRLRNDRLYEE